MHDNMESLLENYEFLLELTKASPSQQQKMLKNATKDQLQAVADGISICVKQKLKPAEDVKKGTRNWKRAVAVLKKNSKLLTPILASVLCTLLREALHYLYNME